MSFLKIYKSRFDIKIAFKIFIIGLCSIILFTCITYYFILNESLKHIKNDLTNSSQIISDNLAKLLKEKAKIIKTFAYANVIIGSLHESNNFYSQIPPQKRKFLIEQKNRKWMSVGKEDPFVIKYRANNAAKWLDKQIKLLHNEYGEIFLTNKFGAVVATTSKLTTFKHNQKYWWKGAYANGRGIIYIDDRGYDDSVGDYVLGIVIPVKEHHQIIGIIKANLKILQTIDEFITHSKDIDVDKILLIRGGGRIIYEKGIKPLSKIVSKDIVRKINKSLKGFTSNNEFFIGFSKVEISNKIPQTVIGGTFQSIDHTFGNNGESWYILTYKSKHSIYTPIHNFIQFIFIILILIILVLAFLSYRIGRNMAKPISSLIESCNLIANGNFNTRINIKRTDEVGKLIKSINNMAEQLERTTTSKKLLEKEIEEKLAVKIQLTNAMLLSPAVIYEVDKENFHIKWISENVKRILGFNKEEIKNPDLFIKQVPENERKNLKKIFDIFEKKEIKREYPFIKKNGRKIYLHDHTILTNDRIFGALIDISDKIKLERRLKLLSTIAEQSFIIVVITDKDGNIVYVNKAFEKTTGYTYEEAIGQNPRILKSFKHPKSFYKNLWETILSGNIWEGEFVNRKKDGNLYYEEANIFPIKDNNGKIINFAAIKKDISEKKELEEQLFETSKLEAIGALAGGVAHDFNNILTVISGNTEMALNFMPQNIKLAEKSLKNVLIATEKASNLTYQLLAFGRKQPFFPKPVNLVKEINDILPIIEKLISEDISFKFEFSTEDIIIYFDTTQLEQILINLIVNARDAIEMKSGKNLLKEIRLFIDKIFLSHNNIYKLNEGEYAKISVSDTGTGISKNLMNKIFEPFFTTKKMGKGTGLGLSTVFGIVKQNKGAVNVKSEIGKGTTFEVLIPVYRKDYERVDLESEDIQIPGGNETILIVEDEDNVKKIIKEVLEKYGYTVMTASNGKEAFEIFTENIDKIDLIISDVIMPEMNGKELFDEIKKINRKIPFLFLSGYPSDFLMKKGVDVTREIFIEKPVSSKKLLLKIREILD